MSIHIHSSQNKHESDIPQLELSSIFDKFETSRANTIDFLESGLCNTQPKTPTSSITNAILDIDITNEPTKKDKAMIFRLEKCFVITGRVGFLHLDNGNEVEEADTYFAFSNILFHFFQKYTDFNALNTAIRVMDKACQLSILNKNVCDIPAALEVLYLEKDVLKSLMSDFSNV